MYRAAPYAWEAESGSVAQITCVIEMRRETLVKFPSRHRPIAARAGYARGHLCYTWLAAALRWYLGARGGQGWTTGGRHVAAMEVRRCRAIATRQALDTARVPKAPPETLPTVARATGATRSGVKKIGAHLPRAHAHPRNAVHHPATPPGIAWNDAPQRRPARAGAGYAGESGPRSHSARYGDEDTWTPAATRNGYGAPPKKKVQPGVAFRRSGPAARHCSQRRRHQPVVAHPDADRPRRRSALSLGASDTADGGESGLRRLRHAAGHDRPRHSRRITTRTAEPRCWERR